MYKPMDIDVRARHIAEINDILQTLERLCVGPFLVGERMSTADVAAFPHFVFMVDMLPRYFGWPDVFAGRPKLAAWWDTVQAEPVVARVRCLCRGLGCVSSWLRSLCVYVRHHTDTHVMRPVKRVHAQLRSVGSAGDWGDADRYGQVARR